MSEVRKTRFASINEGQITTPRYGHRPKSIQIQPESILKIKRYVARFTEMNHKIFDVACATDIKQLQKLVEMIKI